MSPSDTDGMRDAVESALREAWEQHVGTWSACERCDQSALTRLRLSGLTVRECYAVWPYDCPLYLEQIGSVLERWTQARARGGDQK